MNQRTDYKSEWVAVIFVIWMLLLAPLYIPNMGGMGLNLPQNVISWAMMVLIPLGILARVFADGKRIVMTSPAKLFISGGVLLFIPILYTHSEWREAAMWRWGGLFCGILFYVSWLQTGISSKLRHTLLYAILLAASIQAILALLQYFNMGHWVPYPFLSGRPYGVFQQVNLLASFIATGLGLALMFYLLPLFRLQVERYEKIRATVLCLLIIIFVALLIWLQSRSGFLAGSAVALLFIMTFARKYPERSCVVVLVMLLGCATGLAVLVWGNQINTVSHTGSDSARRLMLTTTWSMISEKPFSGWGMGGFEYNFQHFRAAAGFSTLGVGVVVHPHNELLFWWVEGGIAGLLGCMLVLVGVLRIFGKAWHKSRQLNASSECVLPLALCFATLPILLHTQTEYPFYLSALHWAVMLFILAQADQLMAPAHPGRALNGAGRLTHVMLLSMITVGCVAVMLAGLQGGRALTRAEQSTFKDMQAVNTMSPLTRYLFDERRDFDLQVYALIIFNQTHDEALLSNYTTWSTAYLKKHIDRNIYANTYLIFKHQGNYEQAERFRRETIALFPNDSRVY